MALAQEVFEEADQDDLQLYVIQAKELIAQDDPVSDAEFD